MHSVKRMLTLCLSLLVLMMTAAQAEVPFLVHSNGWVLDGTPVDVMLKADVETHMPFDADRLAMLTPITDLLSLRVVTGDNEGFVTIAIAEQEALTLQYRGNEARLSCLPDVTYTAAEDPMSMLLGAETNFPGVYEALGLSPQGESLLTDGQAMLAQIPTALEKYGKKYQSSTNISGYGKSTYRMDFNFASGKGDLLKEGLLAACPEGWLREIIDSLNFSGKQALRIYYDANDNPLRVEFNGSCGPEGDNRTVKLVCRFRHDEEMDKEYIELTTPAKKGKNKNNLTFERTVQTNKKGERTVVGSFKYTRTKDNVTSIWNGEYDLRNAFTDDSDVLSGSFTIQKKLNGADKYEAVTIAPELTVSGTQDAPVITGWVNITEQYAGKVTEQAKVSIEMKRADAIQWPAVENLIDLSSLEDADLAVEQQKIAASVATAIVRPLITVLGEDAEYFFRELPEEAVQSIIDAAASANQ